MSSHIGIIRYNMGNVTSVHNAFEKLNFLVTIINTPEELRSVTHIVLPGVGAFSEGMRNLHALGFVKELAYQIREQQKPFLGICLGLQLLAEGGEEGGVISGLGYLPGRVIRLPDLGLRIPHIGWNTVTSRQDDVFFEEPNEFYFVHSYYLATPDSHIVVGACQYGVTFPAVVHKGNIYGTQFHPEKSHAAGLELLRRFASI